MPWHLIWKNLRAHPLRTLLTVASIFIAVLLICVLRSIIDAFGAGVAGASSNRLVVQSSVSLFVELPLAYQGKIAAVPGVARTCKFQWFGGYYQEPGNFFAQFGVDADVFFDSYPEVELLEGTQEAFQGLRTGCLVGHLTARKFGFTVGSKVPITGTIFQRAGGGAWEFEVTGIYRSTSSNVDDSTLFFHYDYLRESLEAGGASGPQGVGVFMVKLAPGADPIAVAREVDALFDQGPQRVQTTTEAEFQRQFVGMMGSVPTFLGSIGGGVLFAIMLAVLNTMLLAGRERTRDIGVMKALGFGDGVAFALLMLEAQALCLLGGALGVGAAMAMATGMRQGLQQLVPTYVVTGETATLGLGLSVVMGLVAGIGPAWRASRLRVVQAIRPEA